jgi:hypothetical protein
MLATSRARHTKRWTRVAGATNFGLRIADCRFESRRPGHGHTANSSGEPRRSIQGAYIRRDAEPAINQPVINSAVMQVRYASKAQATNQ